MPSEPSAIKRHSDPPLSTTRSVPLLPNRPVPNQALAQGVPELHARLKAQLESLSGRQRLQQAADEAARGNARPVSDDDHFDALRHMARLYD